jgi:hypothetical protein
VCTDFLYIQASSICYNSHKTLKSQGQSSKMAELPNGMAVSSSNDVEMKEEAAEVRVLDRHVRMRR